MDTQSSKLSCFQDNGKPPTDRRRLNIPFSNILPKSTSPLCRSIYSLTQTLLDLNLKITSEEWKLGPSLEKLNTVSSLPDSILLHPLDSIPRTALNSASEKIPPIHRLIFLEDLELSNFPGWTFAWDQPWESRWNQLLSRFILKHWQHALQAGSFKSFHMDPSESSDPIIQSGIIHCWLFGQEEGLRLGRFSPERREKKKKSRFRLQVRNFLKF
ncbi:hypothetical protein PSTT_02337 [Puccinia striiformis]|uniref:Uncharacterized protein n=1 Tax=Puccinia striiformis TaxID=27350 RepID=A0A2S4W051_9BASI|nr:hypothetical protein PSTT_02337 [Puccinia striiformis]